MDHRTKEALRYLGYGRNPGEERTLELIRQSFEELEGLREERIVWRREPVTVREPDQVETAACIVFSHGDVAGEKKLQAALELVRAHNPNATVVTTAWSELDGKQILEAMEHSATLATELAKLESELHDHDDEDEHEHCHHHDHDDEDDHCCHHDHDDEDEHDHCCHHDHEGHHHHHHADEVFSSWGVETSARFTPDGLKGMLSQLGDAVRFGTILRAKGIVQAEDGSWIHFDYVPGEIDVRSGSAEYTGRLCVIGSKLDEEELKELFEVA